MREEAEKWLRQALEDLATAKDTITTGHYYASAFWAEQAAEKALKALLIAGGKIERTHDLNELLEIIKEEIGLSVEEIRSEIIKLTLHYTISRYPDAANTIPYSLYSKEDAEELVKKAEKVIEWVKRNLH
ncbi:HEPN domain protein [Sulfolobus islandicus Y.N.15.51]|jgi:HEPN domain-containing protein|uniref:HEPN domain protein n=1 Tax=Saccharolobus islandicus (strain Y.N.15.51 / Yellowstone \|nr:HEPN domain-containing protein [Sulfolobus islandicus]ACP48889.1 HEPN domain protein [Sulfolobus islandicus Y.N.15.51]